MNALINTMISTRQKWGTGAVERRQLRMLGKASFGNRAVSDEIPGFAAPPHDGCALVEWRPQVGALFPVTVPASARLANAPSQCSRSWTAVRCASAARP